LRASALSAYDIAGWAGFLAVVAGVAATLTGLIFVAVSINLARILEFPGLPERAAETIVQLLGAMIIALIGLVPGQSALVLGVELAGAGHRSFGEERYRRSDHPGSRPRMPLDAGPLDRSAFGVAWKTSH
jgi:hypothetical protein